jgi:integrase
VRLENLKKNTQPSRRTLKFIDHYPSPEELYRRITDPSKGIPYKTNKAEYRRRDQALAALLYLLCLRISEALRLTKSQFSLENDRVLVQGIQLSKTSKAGRPRRDQYRQENWLALEGRRGPLTQLVLDHLDSLAPEEKLFKFGRKWAWKIVSSQLDIPEHWLRAMGENYLYDLFDHDILAVSDFCKISVQTLPQYIRARYKKYRIG